ncbi:MAG: glutamine--fructose-6-phosphate transaminase (isomerizing) [Nitrososphaera sp.]|nr:glutamine--fructose-6-phosphate transaminase (isomerizing) [Nitrososphaera sp.]
MCSIIGYKGKNFAAPILVNSLKRMEYRGYDSVGVATIDEGKMLVRKGTGKVAEVNKKLDMSHMLGNIGIGHTRWATHGGVTDKNAHPHAAGDNKIAVVHNGIIENYKELKSELIKTGYIFASETDSEVIAHLLNLYFNETKNIKQALMKTCKRLQGAYAFVAVFDDGTIGGVRYEEPLIVGVAKDGYFVSSDVLGFLEHTDKAIFLDNGDITIVNDDKIQIFDFNGKPVDRPITQVAWELGDIDKGKYAHHTLKEIDEQKLSIVKAYNQEEARMKKFLRILRAAKNVYIVGSGTSYHSALVAKHVFGMYAKMRVEAVMSSESKYVLSFLDEDSVVIAISQSGETADVLDSVRLAKSQGVKVLSIVNVTTSSLARMSDAFLGTNSGPEIGVAATKSFTAQLIIIYALADRLCRGKLGLDKEKLIHAVDSVLSNKSTIEKLAQELKNNKDLYLLGRSLHYPIALEGALKVKELAYVHAEGIAAGELKHGPLALMEKNTIVMILNPHDTTFNDTISNAHEIKARGATVVGLSDQKEDVYDYWIPIPALSEEAFYPIVEVIPLQFLAYYLAVGKNIDPDYPRNLAKSVTVR